MENKAINVVLTEYKASEDKKSYASKLFYDWFCSKQAIPNKAVKLMGNLKMIAKSKKFNPEKCYVFFKNNCGWDGLYDDFRICDIATGDVIYTIAPKEPQSKYGSVWGAENDFEKALFVGTWAEIKEWFNN